MENWKEGVLIDIAKVIMGQSPKGADCNVNGKGMPLLNGPTEFGLNHPHPIQFTTNAKRLSKKNDLLFCVRGSTTGRMNWSNKPYAIGRGIAAIRHKKNEEYRLFIKGLIDFNLPLILQSATGSTFPNVSKSHLENLEILIPPLPEQKAIAEVLSSLDDKIDLLHRQNETLEEMAQTLFRQWFVERADESWEEIEFGDFLTPQKGKNLTRAQAIDGPYPVVAGGLDPMCTHNMSNTEKPVITISASGANAGFIRLYNQKVWSSDSSFIDKKITPYVYFSYLFLKFNQEILFDRQTGSAQPHIYPKQIMELEFRNYPEHLIIEFDQWCEDLFEKIKFNQIQIQTLEKLRDTLLPKLMSGEVRVKI